MTRTSPKHHLREHRPARHLEVPHPPEVLHPLTVGNMHWLLPTLGAVLGLFVGLGLLLAFDAKRPVPLIFWLGHSRVASLGKPVVSDLYEINMGGLRVAKPDPAFTPAAGDDIVVLSLGVKNKDKAAHGFYPSIQTFVRDEEGTTYTMHPALDIKKPLPAGDIASGAEADGEVSFELPKRLHKFWLYVDPHWVDMAPVVYTIER